MDIPNQGDHVPSKTIPKLLMKPEPKENDVASPVIASVRTHAFHVVIYPPLPNPFDGTVEW